MEIIDKTEPKFRERTISVKKNDNFSRIRHLFNYLTKYLKRNR